MGEPDWNSSCPDQTAYSEDNSSIDAGNLGVRLQAGSGVALTMPGRSPRALSSPGLLQWAWAPDCETSSFVVGFFEVLWPTSPPPAKLSWLLNVPHVMWGALLFSCASCHLHEGDPAVLGVDRGGTGDG
jgi:hypothetical protein